MLPDESTPAKFSDNWRLVVEVSETGVRWRKYDGNEMFHELIAVTSLPETTEIVVGTTFPVTVYERERDSGGQWEEWAITEDDYTIPELSAMPEFCGFSWDRISGVQYVGEEVVNGLNTRHYAVSLDGKPWELWVAPNGRPAKLTAWEHSTGLVLTFSGWDETEDVTAPVLTPTPTPTPVPTPT